MKENNSKLFFIFYFWLFSFVFPSLLHSQGLCSSNGHCYAYYYDAPPVSECVSSKKYVYTVFDSTCPGDITTKTAAENIFCNNVTFKVKKWNTSTLHWDDINVDVDRDTTIDVRNSLVNLMESLNVPFDTSPNVYLPNGPPDDCGNDPDPTCEDSEKICEIYRLYEDGKIYASGYVSFDDASNSDSYDRVIEYVSPDYEEDNDYSSIISIPPDCFCPEDSPDHDFPSDFGGNFSITENHSDPTPVVPDNIACAQTCYPKGYFYSEENCICVDDSGTHANTPDSPVEPPDSSPDSGPSDPPADPGDIAGQLATVNGNLGSLINQGNQSGALLSNIAGNLATSVGNQGDIVSAISNLGDELGALSSEDEIAALGDQLSSIGDTLDDIQENQPENIVADTGGTGLPDVNTYDPDFEQPEESDFGSTVSDFVTSGLPIISYIQGTYISLENSESSMCVDLWSGNVCFDFSTMEPILNTMGLVLVGICVIIAFMIII